MCAICANNGWNLFNKIGCSSLYFSFKTWMASRNVEHCSSKGFISETASLNLILPSDSNSSALYSNFQVFGFKRNLMCTTSDGLSAVHPLSVLSSEK